MNIYEIYFKIKIEACSIKKYYQKNGLYRTVMYWLARMVTVSGTIVFKKEKFIFFEHSLSGSAHNNTTDDSCDLLCADKDDIEKEKEYFDGWYDKRLAIKHLEKGDVLLTYKLNGIMIFFQWLVFENVYIRAVNLLFSIPDTTAYMAYTYTVPEYRGRRMASRAKTRALEYLRGLGYKKVFILIKPDNEPSIKVNRNAGFREYQTLFYMRVFLFLQCCRVKDCASDREKVFWNIGKTDQQIWKVFSKI